MDGVGITCHRIFGRDVTQLCRILLHIVKATITQFISCRKELKDDLHTQLAASQGLAQSVFHDFERTLDETGLQSASNALWLQPCKNISKKPVSQHVRNKCHPKIDNLYSVWGLFLFWPQGQDCTWILHTPHPSGCMWGEPTEFSSQLASFQWPSYFPSFPKIRGKSFKKLTCKWWWKNLETFVDYSLCADILTNWHNLLECVQG